MSDHVKTIDARLARLQQFADLFQHELKEIRELLKTDHPATITSPLSTSPEEMQAMLDGLAKQAGASTKTHPPGTPHRRSTDPEQRRHMSYFTGSHSVLVNHLSPMVIERGNGAIQPSAQLQQYEESATESPASIVKQWPNGFYRNQQTKEMQLLIQLDSRTFIFDGLPGNDGMCYLIEHESDAFRPVHELAEEERYELMHQLDHTLNMLVFR